MRIFTRCVYSWRPDGSPALESAESFDYEGPIALCKDSPSPPPAPDYPAAAQATSQGSVQAAIANNLLNMRNTSTPLGSQTFTPSGTFDIPSIGGQPGFQIPQFSQNVSMTPQGQNLYNQQMGLSTGLLGLGQNALNRVAQGFGDNPVGQPVGPSGSPTVGGIDFSSFRGMMDPGLPEIGSQQSAQPQSGFQQGMPSSNQNSVQDVFDQSYGLQTQRLDPQWQQRAEQQRTMLANQGLAPGGEAYTNAMRDFNNARNDAYGQARLSSISTMPQTYQLGVAQRMQPLTELNAIRTGAQPQMPQFQGMPAAGGAQGPNMLGAAQAQYGAGMDQYNSQVGQNNAMMSGLFSLGGAAIGSPWFGKLF